MKKIVHFAAAVSLGIVALTSFSVVMPATVLAQANSDATTNGAPTSKPLSFEVPNPLGSQTTTLNGFLANILDAIVLLLTPVITIMLLYCGFLFVAAQGNTEKLGDAKKALMYTLIGAAVILGAKGLSEVLQNTVTCLTSTGSC